jgi:predicted transcriptional regulator
MGEWRSLDGIPLVVAPGHVEVDEVEDRVRCALCGGWWRSVASHAFHAHGLTGRDYRQQVGLRPGQALCARTLSDKRSRQLRERMATDPRIAVGMQRGVDRARNGTLQARARELAGEHSSRAARAGELKVHGHQLGTDRAERYRAERAARATELGFDSLDAYLQQRYVVQQARLEDLQREVRRATRRCEGTFVGPGSSRDAGGSARRADADSALPRPGLSYLNDAAR